MSGKIPEEFARRPRWGSRWVLDGARGYVFYTVTVVEPSDSKPRIMYSLVGPLGPEAFWAEEFLERFRADEED